MLISDFVKESLSLGDAQFAISLALSQLGEERASKAVLTYLATKDADISVVERRQEVNALITESNQGMIPGLLNVLSTNKVLSVVSSNRATKVRSYQSLTDLLETQTIKNVYNQTMHIVCSTNPSKYLLLYMDSPDYKKHFFRDVRGKFYKSADGLRNNNLSDGVCEEIRQSFRKWIDFYSSNGVYDPASGAPMAYLRNAFSSMYAAGADSEVYTILNRTGTNMDVGENATMMDFIGLESVYEESDFDFIEVANRINRASRLLFSHNNNPIAFYDIFSCYRDGMLTEKFENHNSSFKRALVGCDICVADSSQEYGRGHEGAVKNKKAGRVALCRVFEPVITNGIAQSQIQELYDNVIKLTDTLSVKDGVRLFSTKHHATKHRESNSEMLQIILSGYLGVRELMGFLEHNDLGASIYNFPAIIFRNAEYLKRFQTVEEYVKYVTPVTMLVEEAAASKDDVDGVVRNEVVWGYLGASNLLRGDMFKKLAEMPLDYIKSAVGDSKIVSREDYFLSHIYEFTKDIKRMHGLIAERLSDNSFSGNFNLCKQLAASILAPDFKQRSADMQYAMSILFVLISKRLFSAEKSPVVDSSGNYLLREPDCISECTRVLNGIVTDTTSKEVAAMYSRALGLRCKALSKVYELYTGETTNNCSWEQLREVFFFTEVLYKLLTKYNERLSSVESLEIKSSLYLLLANIATDTAVYELKSPLSSCDDLSFIFEKGFPQYFINKIVSPEETIEYSAQRNTKLLLTVNRFLECHKENVNALHIAFDLLDQYVAKKYSPVVRESQAETLLISASEAVRMLGAYNQANGDIRSRLEGMFKADKYGYVMCGSERFVLDDKYVLISGHSIRLDLHNNVYIPGVLTEDEFNILQNRLIFRSC